MSDKDKLKSMLDNLIKNKPEQAQVEFHEYLQGKMQDVMQTQTLPPEQQPGVQKK